MLKMTRRKLIAALLCTPFIAGAAWAQGKGLITIIVNDPANPYWFTEGNVRQPQKSWAIPPSSVRTLVIQTLKAS